MLVLRGCEHCQMIWNSTRMANKEKREMHVVWIDLLGLSFPQLLLEPPHLPRPPSPPKKGLLWKWLDSAFMRFSTKRYTTELQVLEVGFMIGSVISPFLLIMCMKMLPRVVRDVAEGEVLDGGIVLPAMKAFMKNVAKLIESKSFIEHLLQRQTKFSVCAVWKPGPRRVAASLPSMVKSWKSFLHWWWADSSR